MSSFGRRLEATGNLQLTFGTTANNQPFGTSPEPVNISALGLGCAKTKSDFVVMPSGSLSAPVRIPFQIEVVSSTR
jgi:hypothetical protein